MKNNIILSILLLAAIATIAGIHAVNASEVTGTVSSGVNSGNVGGTLITTPSTLPAAGTYTSTQSVSLSAAGSQSIHYTVDGLTPTCSSGSVYGSAIAVNSTSTIKAISCYSDNGSSSVATFVYTINLTIVTSQLPSLLDNGTFVPAGDQHDTPSIGVTQQVTLNVADVGMSTVILIAGTTISRTDGSSFDATALTAGTITPSSLSGLGTGMVVNGALQWGLVNLGLEFSNHPISVSIFVGAALNGQTLNVQRSTTGNTGWTSDGIVTPTCLVTDGLCSFSATKASYYAVLTVPTSTPTPTPTPSPSSGSSGGGGGGGYYASTSTPTPTPTSASGQILGAVITVGDPANLGKYNLKEGDTVSAAGSNDPDVYIVNAFGYKRLFLNPIIFNFYGHLGGWKKVKKITSVARNAFPTSGLFRNCETNDQKVYGVETTGEDTGVFHWVNTTGAQAVADDPNFFKKVFCINTNEFNWYSKGTNYTSVNQIPIYSRQ